MNTPVNTAKFEAARKALEALAPLAKELAAIDKTKVEDSEDKFLLIRMARLDHLIREVTKGKSLRS